MSISLRYQSKYTDKKVTPAQYIAELICEFRSRQINQKLSQRFWNEPGWKGYYNYQIVEANKLLQSFISSVIIQAIKETEPTSLKSGRFLARCRSIYKERKLDKPIDVKIVEGSVGSFKKKKSILDEL